MAVSLQGRKLILKLPTYLFYITLFDLLLYTHGFPTTWRRISLQLLRNLMQT